MTSLPSHAYAKAGHDTQQPLQSGGRGAHIDYLLKQLSHEFEFILHENANLQRGGHHHMQSPRQVGGHAAVSPDHPPTQVEGGSSPSGSRRRPSGVGGVGHETGTDEIASNVSSEPRALSMGTHHSVLAASKESESSGEDRHVGRFGSKEVDGNSAANPTMLRSDSKWSKASSFGGSEVSFTEQEKELYDSFFSKVQRTVGKKGTISKQKVVDILTSQSKGTWAASDVDALFCELEKASSVSMLGEAMHRGGLSPNSPRAKKREVPFRVFRNAILHPHPNWRVEVMNAVVAIREVAIAEDALDVIMSAMEVAREEDEGGGAASRLDKYLDVVMTVVIIANALSIGIFVKADTTTWGLSQSVDAIFTLIFLGEILVKWYLRGVRPFFFGSDWKWNLFDVFIVMLGIVDIALTLFFTVRGKVNTSSFLALRLVRLLRLARLARALRVTLFRELKLMVNGMIGLLRTLSCTIVLLGLMVYLLGILMVQIYGNVDDGYETVPGQSMLFSSVDRSMYTVFRCLLIGDCNAIDGTPVALHISENVGWPYMLGYCGACILMHYGVGSLITALVVDSTLNAAKTAEFRRANQEEEKRRIARKIYALAEKLQKAQFANQWGRQLTMQQPSSQLFVTRDLFMEVCKQKDAKNLLDEVDVDERDRADLFEAIDADGNGRIELDELVEGIMKMRGNVRKADIVATRLMTSSLLDKVISLEHSLAESLFFVESQLQVLIGNGPMKDSNPVKPAAKKSVKAGLKSGTFGGGTYGTPGTPGTPGPAGPAQGTQSSPMKRCVSNGSDTTSGVTSLANAPEEDVLEL